MFNIINNNTIKNNTKQIVRHRKKKTFTTKFKFFDFIVIK